MLSKPLSQFCLWLFFSGLIAAGLQSAHVSALEAIAEAGAQHTDSLHERTHLQERSCSTASGAGEPCIHSTTRFPSSSVVQPQSVGLGTNGEGSRHLTRRKLTRVHFCTPCIEDLVTKLVDLCCAGGRKVHTAGDLLQLLRELFRYFP